MAQAHQLNTGKEFILRVYALLQVTKGKSPRPCAQGDSYQIIHLLGRCGLPSYAFSGQMWVTQLSIYWEDVIAWAVP